MKNMQYVVLVIIFTFVSGCGVTAGFVSVERKFADGESVSGHHRVVKGETLYSIAWRYGLDFRDLASVNSISSPYTIYPGQKISLAAGAPSGANTSFKTVNKSTISAASGLNTSNSTRVVAPIPIKKPVETPVNDWIWPANGRLISQFSTTPPLNKGVDIEGALGESVKATMAGTVVYAGQGLRGYGNLVIIKHNETYLSAYAHANKIVVSEQETVKAGQKIAEIGSTGTDKNKLHFEIRQNGQPVDPLQYLPKR